MNATHDCQPELNLRLRRTPERLANDVRELEQLLRGRSPLLAREIEALRPEWAEPDHRYVRKLAALSAAVLSAPGVKGYFHADAISLESLQHIAAARTAQIRAEGRELIRIRQILALRCKTQTLTTHVA